MKKLKFKIAFLCCAVLTAGILTGCSSKKSTSQTEAAAQDELKKSSGTETAAESETEAVTAAEAVESEMATESAVTTETEILSESEDAAETEQNEDHPEPAPSNQEESVYSEQEKAASETEASVSSDISKENEAMQTLYNNYIRDREANGEKWSVGIENLTTGEVVSWEEDRVMQSASVIKVFIMGAVYDRICYPSDDSKAISYQESYDGELRSLLEQMITVSSNEAANRCIEILGEEDFKEGSKVVNEFCQEHGYTHTSVGRRFLESNPTGDNYTSASDCRKILADIYQGKLVSSEASGKMLDILKGQTVTYKIPAGLPEGYSSANKTGEMPEGYGLGCIENDIAIVFSPKGDYVLTVLSNDLGGRNSEADENITRISSYVAEHQEELFSESAEQEITENIENTENTENTEQESSMTE